MNCTTCGAGIYSDVIATYNGNIVCVECNDMLIKKAASTKRTKCDPQMGECPLCKFDKEQKQSILLEAEGVVNGARRTDYGPHESFDRIAKIGTILIGKELVGRDVIKILLAVKLVRESFKHKRDNLVDLAGYASLLNEIEEGE